MPHFVEIGQFIADLQRFFKTAVTVILDFKIVNFYWLLGSVPNFVKIGQSVAKIL